MMMLKEIGIETTLTAISNGEIQVDQEVLDELTKIHQEQVELAARRKQQMIS
jgi:hypothetical protein